MWFAVSDLSNDIKSQELQPLCKVTGGVLGDEKSFSLVQELLQKAVYGTLILNDCSHGESATDAFAKLCMILLIGSGEERE